MDANNGKGSDPGEVLVIGGRAPGDACHNPAVAISEVRVYDRALDDGEVEQLYNRGQSLFQCRDEGMGSWDPRIVQKLVAAQEAPKWDESTGYFWCSTGVNAYDLPNGPEWQEEFQEKMASSKTTAMNRTLCVDASAQSSASGTRMLARHSSDPERRLQRAAHSSALQQMSRKPGEAILVQGRKVALFRFHEHVYAVSAECPHQGGRLAEGEIGDIEDMVDGRRCYVTCPVHKFRFDLSSGEVLEGTCGPLPTYPVRLVMVNNDQKTAMVEVGFASLGDDFFVEFGADDF